MNQQFHVMIGLPRSGSTVLCALLNQNPNVYVSPTSPLLGYLLKMQEGYDSIEESIANPNFPQLTRMCKAMIESAWSDKPVPHVIDKHRGWGKNIPALETVLGKEVKIIATTRDLASVMASWKILIGNDEILFRKMWNDMTRDTAESLAMARKTSKKNMLEVNYDSFMQNPIETLHQVENHLGIPHYTEYDFQNIQKLEEDNDLAAWGLKDLHKIRPVLGKTSRPAREILGDQWYNFFESMEKEYV